MFLLIMYFKVAGEACSFAAFLLCEEELKMILKACIFSVRLRA